MSEGSLLKFGGEFRDAGSEAAFRAARLPETLRQCRLIFILSAVLNVFFLVSDWRFQGTPHFLVAVSGRLFVIATSLLCVALIRRATSFRRAEAVTMLWEICIALGVGLLVSSRSDLALFVVLLLPSIFYLVAPTSFLITLTLGLTCSVVMLAGYLGAGPYPTTLIGLVLVLVMLNFALGLVVVHANRLRRLEWLATQSERRAKEELGESRAMIERIFMAVPIPLVVVSQAEGRFLRANDAALSFLGKRDPSELDDIAVADVFSDARSRRDMVRQLDDARHVDGFEAVMRDASGAPRDMLLTASRLSGGQDGTVVTGLVDITERKAAEARTHWQATHDALTGLPNRLMFQERLQRALAGLGDGGMVSVFLIDLDDFKSINDTLGHDAGDRLLIEAAMRLAGHVDPGDLVARLGGDEFVVVSSDRLTPEMAQAKADRLLAALRIPFDSTGQSLSARASLGIALAPEHHSDPGELLKDADLALYRAKATGRNKAIIYDPSMRKAMNARVEICRDLAEALAQDRIVPFYQPQVCLRTGAIDGFEALARWRHPERGIVPAGAFQLAFDDPEMALQIGDAMLRHVIADLRRWLDAGLDMPRIWVNFAPTMFRDPHLPQILLARLAEANVPPALLGVEVTETVLLARYGNEVERALRSLRESGIRVALDDFGTGYASLTHLKRLPVDVIKIDRSFIANIGVDRDDAAIVHSLIALAAELGLGLVAEGVEEQVQEEFLRARGCGFAQGYRYARPVAANRVPWLMQQPGLLPVGSASDAGQGGVVAA